MSEPLDESRSARDGDDGREPAEQPAPHDAAEEEKDPEVVLHSLGDDEEQPWCIGVSAAR